MVRQGEAASGELCPRLRAGISNLGGRIPLKRAGATLLIKPGTKGQAPRQSHGDLNSLPASQHLAQRCLAAGGPCLSQENHSPPLSETEPPPESALRTFHPAL